jgi:hypothetical protein
MRSMGGGSVEHSPSFLFFPVSRYQPTDSKPRPLPLLSSPTLRVQDKNLTPSVADCTPLGVLKSPTGQVFVL